MSKETCLERAYQEMVAVSGPPADEDQGKAMRNLFAMGFFAGCKVFAEAGSVQERTQIALDLLTELQLLAGNISKPESETAH